MEAPRVRLVVYCESPRKVNGGAKFARIMIEGRTADGSKQHGLGGEAGLNCSVRQGIAELCQSNAADFFFVKLEIVAKAAGHFF